MGTYRNMVALAILRMSFLAADNADAVSAVARTTLEALTEFDDVA